MGEGHPPNKKIIFKSFSFILPISLLPTVISLITLNNIIIIYIPPPPHPFFPDHLLLFKSLSNTIFLSSIFSSFLLNSFLIQLLSTNLLKFSTNLNYPSRITAITSIILINTFSYVSLRLLNYSCSYFGNASIC